MHEVEVDGKRYYADLYTLTLTPVKQPMTLQIKNVYGSELAYASSGPSFDNAPVLMDTSGFWVTRAVLEKLNEVAKLHTYDKVILHWGEL